MKPYLSSSYCLARGNSCKAKQRHLRARASYLALILSASSCALSCKLTPAELQAASSAFEALTQNKNISEQLAKDVKGTFEPSDIQYRSVMSLYEMARDDYNDYLTSINTSNTNNRSVVIGDNMTQLQQRTAEFVRAAARALDPSFQMRDLQTERAIVFPPTLSALMRRLSPVERHFISHRLGSDLRLRPWSQL